MSELSRAALTNRALLHRQHGGKLSLRPVSFPDPSRSGRAGSDPDSAPALHRTGPQARRTPGRDPHSRQGKRKGRNSEEIPALFQLFQSICSRSMPQIRGGLRSGSVCPASSQRKERGYGNRSACQRQASSIFLTPFSALAPGAGAPRRTIGVRCLPVRNAFPVCPAYSRPQRCSSPASSAASGRNAEFPSGPVRKARTPRDARPPGAEHDPIPASRVKTASKLGG